MGWQYFRLYIHRHSYIGTITNTAHTGAGLSAASPPQGHCTKAFSGLFAALPTAGRHPSRGETCDQTISIINWVINLRIGLFRI